MKKNLQPSRLGRTLIHLTFFLFLATLVGLGCTKDQFEILPAEDLDQDLIELSMDLPEVQAAMAVQDRYTERLMRETGVVGTATGATPEGIPAILVMVEEEAVASRIPESLENIPVIVMVTGEIRELKGRPSGNGGGGIDPTSELRPVPNGVSIGHPDITAGTLGCLVSKGGTTYILSNNHVMADENRASNGDPIYQPGPYDGGTSADNIASLSDWVDINFSGGNNLVDAAIAAVRPGIELTGETPSYGAPNATTSNASINLRVMKYGRTTEDTNGRVQGLNATVNVGYDAGVARFVDQIVIGGGGFSSGGDSGSLIVVQRGSESNNPVGLLFAGGGGYTIANSIDDVLAAFGVSISGASGGGSN